MRQTVNTSSTISGSPEAYLCEIFDLNIIAIIMRSSVKDIQGNIAMIQYKGRLQKGKILFRGKTIL